MAISRAYINGNFKYTTKYEKEQQIWEAFMIDDSGINI